MKLLLFKISSCGTCIKQEELLNKYSIKYISCELFENRELARRYNVTDTPTLVLIDNNNDMIKKYDYLINKQQLEKISNILKNN